MWLDDRPVDYDEIKAETRRVGHTVGDGGRVLFADDPAVGPGSIATGVNESGQLVTDEITDQLPVALFEPRGR